MRNLAVLLCTAGILVFSPAVKASTYLDINDEAYALLSRLEAEGVIRSGLLTTKPISRSEAVRLLHEAEANADGRSGFIKTLVRDLRERIRPETGGLPGGKLVDSGYVAHAQNTAGVRTLTYGMAREKEQASNTNNDGDLYARGGNERIGFITRVEDVAGLSLLLNPEFRSQEDDRRLVLRKGYAVYDFGWDFVAGRDSQWWGPGYHGALLLSDNAAPMTMIKIANSSPLVMPWIFRYMGPAGFALFATQLEQDRSDVARPYLWGLRMNFKPRPGIELGFERTALLGGRGRPTTGRSWYNSFIGRDEHGSNDLGDQRAGYDVKLTLPFEMQPAQVYLEAVAEDSVHTMPSQWAYLYGLYLPSFLSLDRVEFRIEYVRTDDGNSSRPSTFYLHHIYTAGYDYHGLIIGHFAGTDSRDLFSELTLLIPERRSRLSLALDRVEHKVSQGVQETGHEISWKAKTGLTRSLELDFLFGYALIHNAGFVQEAAQRSSLVSATLTQRF